MCSRPELLSRLSCYTCRVDRVSAWEKVDTRSQARCSGLFREVQAFTSEALILFFAEPAQPLPVFGYA
jgi:hypothetical protein